MSNLGIQRAAVEMSSSMARRVSAYFGLLLLCGACAITIWNSYFKVNDGVSAINEQVSNFVRIGDRFQLRAQLLSLASSGIIDFFMVSDPNGLILVNNNDSRVSAMEKFANLQGEINFSIDGFSIYLMRKFKISSSREHTGVI